MQKVEKLVKKNIFFFFFGQEYDRATAISRKFRGIQKYITSELPYAL